MKSTHYRYYLASSICPIQPAATWCGLMGCETSKFMNIWLKSQLWLLYPIKIFALSVTVLFRKTALFTIANSNKEAEHLHERFTLWFAADVVFSKARTVFEGQNHIYFCLICVCLHTLNQSQTLSTLQWSDAKLKTTLDGHHQPPVQPLMHTARL